MKTYVEVRGEDGSFIMIRTSQINLITIPSRFGANPNAVAQVLVGPTMINLPPAIAQGIIDMLSKDDDELQRNLSDLNGMGVARN